MAINQHSELRVFLSRYEHVHARDMVINNEQHHENYVWKKIILFKSTVPAEKNLFQKQ